jgi:hypothetical protein
MAKVVQPPTIAASFDTDSARRGLGLIRLVASSLLARQPGHYTEAHYSLSAISAKQAKKRRDIGTYEMSPDITGANIGGTKGQDYRLRRILDSTLTC